MTPKLNKVKLQMKILNFLFIIVLELFNFLWTSRANNAVRLVLNSTLIAPNQTIYAFYNYHKYKNLLNMDFFLESFDAF